jgi:hypothetical protein
MIIPIDPPFQVGDVVWTLTGNKIVSETITQIFITLTGDKPAIQYQTDKYSTIRPEKLDVWFRTRPEVVEYIQKNIIEEKQPEPKSPLKSYLDDVMNACNLKHSHIS